MPGLGEISASIRGAFRLFLFDASGFGLLNLSVAGFWRSFFAAVILAPVYFYIVTVQQDIALAAGTTEELAKLPDLTQRMVAEAIAYPVHWAAFPLAMIVLVNLLRVTDRYVPYIIAYNWSSTVVVTLQIAPFLLFSLGVLEPETMAAPVFATLIIALIYRWFITRTALGLGTLTAVGIVMIDLMLSLLIAATAERLIS